MRRITIADVVVMVGAAMLATGIAMYDWRIALIVCGGVLTAIGLFGSLRGS